MSDPDNDAKRLRDAIRALLVAHAAMNDLKRPCGTKLSMPHAHALLELAHGPKSVSALAERLNIDRTNVGRLCAAMEEAGELSRTTNPTDGRAKLLELTEKGAHLATLVDESSVLHFQNIMNDLSFPVDDLISALAALVEAMQRNSK